MPSDDLYASAHLFVAAVRMLQHQKNTPPSVDLVCDALSFSLEQGYFIARELQHRGIINMVEGNFGTRLFVQDHRALEQIPQNSQGSRLDDELKRFQTTRPDYDQKIASFKSKQHKKQQNLFAELEKKLKQDLEQS